MTNNDNLVGSSYPASFNNDNIISVAATNCYGDLTQFSNYGPNSVDLPILGEGVLGPNLEEGIVPQSGTSQSAAIITGLSAVLGTHLSFFSPIDIKCALIQGSRAEPSLEGMVLSGDIVDGLLALDRIQSSNCEMLTNPKGLVSKSLNAVSSTTMYPNPVQDLLTIIPSKEISRGPLNIRVSDIKGNLILNQFVQDSDPIQFNLSSLESGLYYVHVLSDQSSSIQSIIKM